MQIFGTWNWAGSSHLSHKRLTWLVDTQPSMNSLSEPSKDEQSHPAQHPRDVSSKHLWLYGVLSSFYYVALLWREVTEKWSCNIHSFYSSPWIHSVIQQIQSVYHLSALCWVSLGRRRWWWHYFTRSKNVLYKSKDSVQLIHSCVAITKKSKLAFRRWSVDIFCLTEVFACVCACLSYNSLNILYKYTGKFLLPSLNGQTVPNSFLQYLPPPLSS